MCGGGGGPHTPFQMPGQQMPQYGSGGKTYQNQLAPCQEETEFVRVSGYVGKPDFARKTIGGGDCVLPTLWQHTPPLPPLALFPIREGCLTLPSFHGAEKGTSFPSRLQSVKSGHPRGKPMHDCSNSQVGGRVRDRGSRSIVMSAEKYQTFPPNLRRIRDCDSSSRLYRLSYRAVACGRKRQ